MLERASACLESSIWCSRNAQKRVTNSKRLLHSAFWSHGATYLDLFPLAFDARRNESLSSVAATTKDQPTTSRFDTPFLDFLYPTQALAYLSRKVISPPDGPRRRNVVGSRHYSSLPRPSHFRDIRVAQLRPYSNQSPLDVLVSDLDVEKEEVSHVPRHGVNIAPQIGLIDPMVTRPADHPTTTVDRQQMLDAGSGAYKSTSLEALREIISNPSSPATLLPRVRALWNVLNERHKEDPHLQRSLHSWLASRNQHEFRVEAWEWSKEILSLIQLEWRNASVYQAAINVAVLRKDGVAAKSLLNEAMKQGIPGDIGANHLMRYYLMRRRFVKAKSLMTFILKYSRALGDSVTYNKVFEGIEGHGWHTSWLPALLQYLDDLPADKAASHTNREFFARIAGRFPAWIANAVGGRFTARVGDFQGFLRRIRSKVWSTNAYEPMLFQLLASSRPIHQKRFTKLVSRIWHDYTAIEGASPSTAVMMEILHAWEQDRISWRNIGYKSDEPALYPKDIRTAWEAHHGLLDHSTRVALSVLAAKSGDVEEVEDLARGLLESSKSFKDPGYFWTYVFVHARRRDPQAAQNAFDRLTQEFNVRPSIRTWDMLLYAYERADDLEGALECYRKRNDAGNKITPHSISSLLNIYAKLGDANAIKELLDHAREEAVPVDTHMMNSLIVAHSQAGDSDQAVRVLNETIEQVKAKKMSGPLRICFNTILSMHAQRRDFPATISTYRQMKSQQIRFDEQSYASIIMALCQRRRPFSAWHIINEVMPQEGYQPTAFHYTLVITGFVRTKDYQYALDIYNTMQQAGIKPTIGTRAAYLKAKALMEHSTQEHREGLPYEQTEDEDMNDPRPLGDTIRELMAAVDEEIDFADGSELGLRHVAVAEAKASLFETLIWVHGRRRCFDAAWELFHTAQSYTAGKDDESSPFRLVTAMMSVYYRSGEHEEVERCWNLLVQEASRARLVQLPQFSAKDKTPATADNEAANEALLDSIESAQADGNNESIRTSPTPAPSKRLLLSIPFRYLTLSLARNPSLPPDRVTSLLTTLLSLLEQSYTIDNTTWNTIIQSLLSLSPPRTLLAFTLTERFLIPFFPGWLYPSSTIALDKGLQHRSKRREGVEYMDYPQRYVPSGERLPTYRTMVYLAHGMLALRRAETVGWPEGIKEQMRGEMMGQVGNVTAVMRRASRTVEKVRELPVVYDELQRRLLRDDEGEVGGRWYRDQG
ncbi:Hypothetical protein D9617_18g033910 [Elsinoe fawcettii]|nr:Hypothetical protein D9617_18g033910 [Elsinoe fawcettii]